MYKQYLDTAYDIYDDGRCFSHKTNKFMKGTMSGDYLTYNITYNDGKKRRTKAHRMVAQMFVPNPDDLPVVNHKDGNKINNVAENLEWVTIKENTRHAHKMNLVPKNSSYGNKFDGSLEGEEWKIIPDFPIYSISNMGRIVNRQTNRLKKPTLNANGYYYVSLHNKGKEKKIQVHQLVYYTFREKLEEPYVVNHIDGIRTNNCLTNLEKVTRTENNLHAVRTTRNNMQAIPVNQIDIETGEVIYTYSSITEAQKAVGTYGISDVLRGIKESSGGFKWERA